MTLPLCRDRSRSLSNEEAGFSGGWFNQDIYTARRENDQMTFAKQRGTIPPKKKWPKRNPTKNPTFTRTKHQTAPGNRTGSHCCSRNLLTSIINPPHPPRDARFFDWNPSTFHPKTRNRYLDPPKKYDPCEAAFDWRQRFRWHSGPIWWSDSQIPRHVNLCRIRMSFTYSPISWEKE